MERYPSCTLYCWTGELPPKGPSSPAAAHQRRCASTTADRFLTCPRAVVGLGKVERLTQFQQNTAAGGAEEEGPEFVALDGSALENLEVLETAGGGSEGTLLSILDACCTPAGRRKLKGWLCRPLGRLRDIALRQDAVHALMTGARDVASSARKAFAGGLSFPAANASKQLPVLGGSGHSPGMFVVSRERSATSVSQDWAAGVGDLERAIARLCASSLGGFGREKSTVVLYEDAAKRRLAAFLAALKGLQTLQVRPATHVTPNCCVWLFGHLLLWRPQTRAPGRRRCEVSWRQGWTLPCCET